MTFPLDKVLLCSLIEVEIFGWVSSKESVDKQGDTRGATGFFVKQYMKRPDSAFVQIRTETLIEEAKKLGIDMFDSKYPEEVKDIIEWAKHFTARTEYERTLKQIAIMETVGFQEIGFAASMISQYRRQKANDVSQHVGKIGDSVTVEGVVTFTKGFVDKFARNQYSVNRVSEPMKYVVSVKDSHDNVIKCWVNEERLGDFKANDKIKITGKVKAHGEYKGTKETTLNYVKFERV